MRKRSRPLTITQGSTQQMNIAIALLVAVVSPEHRYELIGSGRRTKPLVPVVDAVFGILSDQKGRLKGPAAVARNQQPGAVTSGAGVVVLLEALEGIGNAAVCQADHRPRH